MNIQYQMHQVTVNTYTTQRDEYGQPRQTLTATRKVDMAIYKTSFMNIETPQFIDCNAVGLTKDFSITTSDQIVDSDYTYNVNYVEPVGRFLRVQLGKS